MATSADLSAYERERLEHIKRNHEQLVRLGLVSEDSKPLCHFSGTEKQKQGPKRKKTLPMLAPESLRRSSRVKKLKPEYDESKINSFGDDDKPLPHVVNTGKKRTLAKPEWDDDDDDDDEEKTEKEILESTTAYLRAAREAFLQFVTSHDGEAPSSADGWRAEAIKRWGELCGAEGQRDWESFVTSRLSKPPPPSPLDLLQEYYAHDMWSLLVCCVLMSRVSSWATKHRCISDFFAAYPTPSAFLEGVVQKGDHSSLHAIIKSLGLFDDRLKGLVGVTEAFLLGDDAFAVGIKENKIRGIGPFGYHSWAIFCRDQGCTLTDPKMDAALVNFCKWRKKQPVETEGAATTVD